MGDAARLERWIADHPAALEAIVARYAGTLARLEGLEDLCQGARVKVLEAGSSFAWQGDEALRAYVTRVARNHLDDRRAYWLAARRNAGHLLRVTDSGRSTGAGASFEPISSRTGPRTFAERREQLDIAMQAVAALLPRDQRILELERAGAGVEGIARELAITREAAGRARLRALERFRRAYELLARSA